MQNIQLGVEHLSLEKLTHKETMQNIYSNMNKNYYWSDDFTAEYYMAQAKAGFIAVTDIFHDEELLLPEIQFAYALLDFENLHISKKVKRLIKHKGLQLEFTDDIELMAQKIDTYHKSSWLSKKYLKALTESQNRSSGPNSNFKISAVFIRDNEEVIAGEIGYIIGNTYTSLTGFSNKEKQYRDWGTAQLVLLGQYLHLEGFDFWNLGQPYMPYKLTLGAKIYDRKTFLKRWFSATGKNHA